MARRCCGCRGGRRPPNWHTPASLPALQRASGPKYRVLTDSPRRAACGQQGMAPRGALCDEKAGRAEADICVHGGSERRHRNEQGPQRRSGEASSGERSPTAPEAGGERTKEAQEGAQELSLIQHRRAGPRAHMRPCSQARMNRSPARLRSPGSSARLDLEPLLWVEPDGLRAQDRIRARHWRSNLRS